MTYGTVDVNAAARLHYWDTVRGFLMVLGVPYHAALVYHPTIQWSVDSPQASVALGIFSDAVHVIRMPAFFVVAGFFAALLLQRREARVWLKGRYIKLALPLLVCILTLNPLQSVLATVSQVMLGGDPAHELRLTAEQMSAPTALWIRHLWFLTVLLYFSTVTAAAFAILPKLQHWQFSRELTSRGARQLLVVVAMAIAVYQVASQYIIARSGLQSGIEKELLDLPKAFGFAPYFAMGLLIQRSPAVLKAFGADRWLACCIGIGLLIASILLADRGPRTAVVLAQTLCAVVSTQAIIGIAQVHFNRESAWVRRLVSASFVIYLFHMPIVTFLGALFIGVNLPPLLEWLLIAALALVGSYSLAGPISRSRLANAAFNGELPKWRHDRQVQPQQAGR